MIEEILHLKRRVGASVAIFLAGMAVSSAVYFSRRPVRFADAVLSNFLSPGDNPRGYPAAAIGTALAGFVLLPSILVFYRRIRSVPATAFYAAGLLAAILIAVLAPFPGIDFSVHLALAYGAFISLQLGISLYLAVAAYSSKSRRLAAWAVVEWVLGILLLGLSFGPDWTGSTAFCEWGLCVTIAAGLWVLTTWCS